VINPSLGGPLTYDGCFQVMALAAQGEISSGAKVHGPNIIAHRNKWVGAWMCASSCTCWSKTVIGVEVPRPPQRKINLREWQGEGPLVPTIQIALPTAKAPEGLSDMVCDDCVSVFLQHVT